MCFCPFAWRINRTRTSSQRMFLRVAVTWTQECIAQPRPPQQSPCDGKKKGKRALRTKEAHDPLFLSLRASTQDKLRAAGRPMGWRERES